MTGLLDSRQAGALSQGDIAISARMVEAGLECLARSGAVETPLESDQLLVAEIYRSMASAQGGECSSRTG